MSQELVLKSSGSGMGLCPHSPKAPPWWPQPSISCCPPSLCVRGLLRETLCSSCAGIQVSLLLGAWHCLGPEQVHGGCSVRKRMNWSSTVSQMLMFNSNLTKDCYILLIFNGDISVFLNRNSPVGQIPNSKSLFQNRGGPHSDLQIFLKF